MAQTISHKKAVHEWPIYIMVVPSFAMVLTFCYFPVISAIYHSFFDWRGGDSKEFIGFANFLRALSDDQLHHSFLVIFILVVANLFKMIPSIAIAVFVHRLLSDKARYIYRVILVLPLIIPSLITLFIWKFFFDPNFGPLNAFLDVTGIKNLLIWLDANFLKWGVFLPDVPISWLSQPQLIIPSLIIWGFPWIGVTGVLIFLAGLESIGSEVYEAAELDGVGPISKFFYIELPLILTQIRLNLILMIIGTLQGFGLQLLLLGESGGPGGAGMVPGLWMYNRAFFAGEFGYACAIGLIIFFFILVLTWVNNKFVRIDK